MTGKGALCKQYASRNVRVGSLIATSPPPPLFAVLGRFWPLVAEMRVAKTGRLLLVLHGGPAVNDYGDWFATQGHGKVVN